MENDFAPMSEQRQRELLIRTKLQEHQFQHLTSEVEDYAIILLDAVGTITSWNKGAEKIKGYSSDDIIGKSFYQFYTPEDRKAGLPDSLLLAARNNNRVSHEGWRVRKDGSRFWGNVTITAIHNSFGEVSGFLKLTRDLTERKIAEDLHKQYIEELRIKNEEISSFAYVASHDLKEPLRKIQTFANRILDVNDLEEVKAFAEKILANATRMRMLMDDLLSYSRVSNDDSSLQPVDLNNVLKSVLSDLDLKILEKAAVINISPMPVIQGVSFQLHQLFANLISNSLKFSKPDVAPVVEITYELQSGKEVPGNPLIEAVKYHRITVRDNGIGFDPANANRIFDVFERLHTNQEISGTGIGLAIVKRVMGNHHGVVHASSASGEGASFDLFFPV